MAAGLNALRAGRLAGSCWDPIPPAGEAAVAQPPDSHRSFARRQGDGSIGLKTIKCDCPRDGV